VTIVSIFVNPLQFGPGEDLAAYPRDLEGDSKFLEREGVDVLFVPPGEEIYMDGEPIVTVDPGPMGHVLEGAARPGHFRGVATVVTNLLSLVGACDTYFGQKDAQQVAIVRRLITDLNLPARLAVHPTVREQDGLAMSSRNAYLSRDERAAAAILPRALARAVEIATSGEADVERIRAQMKEIVATEPLVRLDYATVVNDETFAEASHLAPENRIERPGEIEIHGSPARVVIAAWVGKTRLIDNMELPLPIAENA
jgi:pantoate--beta-alanine ligase